VQILPEGALSVTQGVNVKMAIPVSFSVDARSLHVTSPSLGIDEAQIQDARGSLRFAPPKGAWLATSAVILMLALALWVIAQLRALFRTVRDGQPFVPANATRVRWIAYAVILGELARSAVVFWGNHYAMIHFSADGLRFDARPHINAFAIIDALIVLAIAEVFRAGTRLDEEHSLTV
jgi:hypothetical protein